MSGGNLFLTRKKAFDLREVDITSSATNTVYEAKVGTPTNDFIVDRVINITTTDGNDFEVDIPAGIYYGQRILINFVTDGNAETVTVDVSTGTDFAMTDVGAYCTLEWVNSTAGWVALASSLT